MIKKDILETEIRTSGIKEVQTEILAISKRIDEHNDSLKRLNAEKNRLITSGQKESKEYRNIVAEIKKINKEITTEEQKYNSLYRSLKLTEMSYSQLKTRAGQLASALKKTSQSAEPQKYAKLNAELKQTNAQIAKMSQGMSTIKKETSIVNSMKGAFSNIMPKLGVASLIAGGIATLKSAVTELWGLVKNLQGDAKRSATVFGDELGYVELQADRLSEKMGVTNREFINMTTGVADLLVPLGFSRKESAKMAVDVQKLTGALNEWTAGKYGAEDISEKLTKAMLGETEGLKTLGIAIRMDSDEYKVLLKEKLKNGAENQAQAQALTILDMLYQKSSDAQASYASSGNELLRFQNSASRGWRSMKESVAEWFAFSSEERAEQQARQYKALSDEFERNEKTINTLLPRYTELSQKANLNSIEQQELRNVIDSLAAIFPQAVSGFDEYGKAIGINTEAITLAQEAQKLLRKEMQKDVAENLIESLAKSTDELDRIQTSAHNFQVVAQVRLKNNKDDLAEQVLIRDKLNQKLAYHTQLEQNTQSQMAKTILTLLEIGYSKEEIVALTQDEVDRGNINLALVDKITQAYVNQLKAKNNVSATDSAPDSLIEQKKSELKTVETWSEKTEEDIKKKNKKKNELKKEIQRLENLGVTDNGSKSQKWALDSDAEFLKKRSALKDQFIKGQIATDEQYNQQLLALEIASLEARIKAGKEKGEDLLKLKEQLLDKQLQQSNVAKKREEALLRAAQGGDDEATKAKREYNERRKELGLFNKAEQDMTAAEKAALLQINKEFALKLSAATLDTRTKAFDKLQKAHDLELTQLRTKQNNEFQTLNTFEKKMAFLKDKFSKEQLAQITTSAEADKAIKAFYAKQEAEGQQKHLQALLEQYNAMLNEIMSTGKLGDVIFSDDDRAKLEETIAKLKLELSKLGTDINIDLSIGKGDNNVDLFGYTQAQWQALFDNVATGEDKFKSLSQIIGAMGAATASALGEVFNLMSAIEERDFKTFEKSQNKKKKALDRQLKAGQISQEHYNEKVQALDEQTDAKKQEMERKQAERQKAMAIFNAIIQTAVAIVGVLGLAFPLNVIMAGIIGTLGAIQIAAIVAQPLPGAEQGGMLVERAQDGKRFDALYEPQRRGAVDRPTVLVGENGTEYVVPAEGYANPTIRPVLDMIEQARQQGQLKQLNLPALMMAGMVASGRAAGGYVSQPPIDPSRSFDSNSTQFNDSETKSLLVVLKSVLDKLSSQLDNPIKAYTTVAGEGGIAKQLDKYNRTKSRTTIG